MNKKMFENIDNIKVPEKTKEELFHKVEQMKMGESIENSKSKGVLGNTKWLFTGIAIGAVCMMFAIPLLNQGVDYQQYVNAASAEITEPYEQVIQDKKALRMQLENGEITLDEYLAAYEELDKKAEKLVAESKKLNEKYGIDEKNVDASIKKASSKEKANIHSCMSEFARLEAEDDRLDALEDQLERDYHNGKISREQFVQQMKNLEAQEDAIDRQEDQLEHKYGQDDDDYDDDRDDDDDWDDDYDDHNDDWDDDHDDHDDHHDRDDD